MVLESEMLCSRDKLFYLIVSSHFNKNQLCINNFLYQWNYTRLIGNLNKIFK